MPQAIVIIVDTDEQVREILNAIREHVPAATLKTRRVAEVAYLETGDHFVRLSDVRYGLAEAADKHCRACVREEPI